MKMHLPPQPSRFIWYSKIVGNEVVNEQVNQSRDWKKEMTKKEIWDTTAQYKLALDLFAEEMDIRNVQKGDTMWAIAVSFKKSTKLKVGNIWGTKVKYEGGFTPSEKQIKHWKIPPTEVEKMKNGDAVSIAYANFLYPGGFVWMDPTDENDKTIIIGKKAPTQNTNEEKRKKKEDEEQKQKEEEARKKKEKEERKQKEEEKKITPEDYEDIENDILNINHNRFEITESATVTMGTGWFQKNKTITNSQPAPFKEFFITDKNNPKNPRYYIILNTINPAEIAVGEYKYDRGTWSTDIDLQSPSIKQKLSSKKKEDIQNTIKEILDQLS